VYSIIGYNGFLGKNLLEQYEIENIYNSKKISLLPEKEHDVLFICAPSAEKWRANQSPTVDLHNISSLITQISKTKVNKIIMFSTVDVYGNDLNQNEDCLIDIRKVHPYGKNRYIFETYLADKFDTTVIRLPALFGKHLKKNIIFDLMNLNQVGNIGLSTSFQWMSTNRIKHFVDLTLQEDIKLINCVSEPIPTKELVLEFYPELVERCMGSSAISYNVLTKYSDNNYLLNKQEVLQDLRLFFADMNQ
jgi:hypothetical protein